MGSFKLGSVEGELKTEDTVCPKPIMIKQSSIARVLRVMRTRGSYFLCIPRHSREKASRVIKASVKLKPQDPRCITKRGNPLTSSLIITLPQCFIRECWSHSQELLENLIYLMQQSFLGFWHHSCVLVLSSLSIGWVWLPILVRVSLKLPVPGRARYSAIPSHVNPLTGPHYPVPLQFY